MEQALERASKLFKKIAESGRNYALFRLVLVFLPSDGWCIYYGDIIFSNKPLSIKPECLYKKSNIQIWSIPASKQEAYEFLSDMIQDKELFTPNIDPRARESGLRPFKQIPVFGEPLAFTSDYTDTYSQTAEKYKIPFPCRTYWMALKPVSFDEYNLPYNRNMAELITQVLGIWGLEPREIIYKFNTHFEIGLGKFTNFSFDGVNVKTDVEMTGDKNRYVILLMLDEKSGINKSIAFSDGRDHLEECVGSNVKRIEARLIYSDIIIDKMIVYQEPAIEKNPPYAKEIIEFKEKVKSILPEIQIPKDLEFCNIVDSRLSKAEHDKHPLDALQSLSDAMEYLCKDSLKMLDILSDEKKKPIGLSLHQKLVNCWRKESKKDYCELHYQTGVRHIIRLGSLKEHEGYEPHEEEIKYLILLAWRGYWEVLRMLKEIQQTNKKI